MKKRSELKIRLTAGLVALMKGLARLPLPWLRRLGTALGELLWWVARSRRHIVLTNLRHCMPELTEAQRRRLARAHLHCFGRSVLDRAWLWHAPAQVLAQRLRWVGPTEELQAPGPMILLAPHFAGLDAGGTAVARDVHGPVAFIFSRQSNPAIDQWVQQGRERFGNVRPCYRHEGMRQIVAGLRRGEPLHLSPDMDLGPQESVFVPFFGVPAATAPSLSRMARVGDARVVPVVTRMTDAGYEVQVYPAWTDFPSQDPVADTLRMNQAIEGWIRQMPEQYHWVHRRFKSRPPGAPSLY